MELTVDLGDVDDFEVGVEAEDPHRKATTLNSHQGPPISRVSTTARLARPLGITKELLHGHLGARPLFTAMSPIREARTGGQGLSVQWAEWASAILFNGLGRYDRALASAQRAAEETPPGHVTPGH